jgi:hypothetical protein
MDTLNAGNDTLNTPLTACGTCPVADSAGSGTLILSVPLVVAILALMFTVRLGSLALIVACQPILAARATCGAGSLAATVPNGS